MAGGGLYSAYVGAIVDLVRLLSGLHTAKYQYIPAIAFPERRSPQPPPQHPALLPRPQIRHRHRPSRHPDRRSSASAPGRSPNYVTCLLKPAVVLPVEGAPLVFSTSFAHDLVLHLEDPGREATTIPLTADAFRGGLVLTHSPARKPLPLDPLAETDSAASNSEKTPAEKPKTPAVSIATPPPSNDTTISGTISGFWGFDPFTGPIVRLQDTPGRNWKLVSTDPLIAGKNQHILLTSTGTACLETVKLDPGPVTAFGASKDQTFKNAPDRINTVEVSLTLPPRDPGTLHLTLQQFGVSRTDTVNLTDYSEPAKLDGLTYHSGDSSAQLTGASLNQVEKLVVNNLTFTPPPNADAASENKLQLGLPSGSNPPQLRPGAALTAQVFLKDGRTLTLPVTVAPSRPSVTLLSKNINRSADTAIQLADPDDLPVNQQLAFSLKSAHPFPRTGSIEIANSDESLHTSLTVASGNLVLQNPHTLLATLDPLKAFGTSAFGPLRLRPVAPDGTTGDWLPLATLVRLPTLKDLRCPSDATQPCVVSGSDLYLVDSFAPDPDFTDPTYVPEGYVGNTLALPRPPKTGFFLKLRDDPTAANPVTLPILPQQALATQKASQ